MRANRTFQELWERSERFLLWRLTTIQTTTTCGRREHVGVLRLTTPPHRRSHQPSTLPPQKDETNSALNTVNDVSEGYTTKTEAYVMCWRWNLLLCRAPLLTVIIHSTTVLVQINTNIFCGVEVLRLLFPFSSLTLRNFRTNVPPTRIAHLQTKSFRNPLFRPRRTTNNTYLWYSLLKIREPQVGKWRLLLLLSPRRFFVVLWSDK